jgi:PAS domain S-box-containing protein
VNQHDNEIESQAAPESSDFEGLDSSESRIGLIADSMPALISYIGQDYRYSFVNRVYSDWFGRKRSEIIGQTMAEVLGDQAFEKLRPHVDAALGGSRHSFESEIPYKDGGTRLIRATYTPDVAPDGAVRGIFVLVMDVTEHQATQRALRESEERYRAFISQSTEGIWRFELDEPIPITLPVEEQVELAFRHGYLAESNDAMARQYGYSSASGIAGARLADLLVADDPKNTEFVKAFIESGYKLTEAESHERDASGKDRYFLNNFVGIVENGFLLRAWGTQRDITQSRVADDATARLAAIVVSSEDAIMSKDLTGIVTSWNVGAAKMFGYKADEVIGKPISILMPPDRSSETAEILRRIRREENIEHFETVRRRKDGSDIVVSLTVSPIRNAEGNVIGASKIVRDITERKRIEETIHQNQAMLTLAMQSSRMGVWELDLATNTVAWSEELEEIFGLEKGSFGGTEEHFFALMHEDDREAAWNEVRLAIGEHRDYNIEFRFHHADGGIRWMEGRGKAVYSQKGDPVRLYGVGIDITDRKEAERALGESEQRFSRFMHHLPGLAWIKDIDGRYVYANESAEKSFGVSGPELYGRVDEEIFPAETAAQFRAHDRRAVESGSGIQILESLVEDDGILHHSIVSKFLIAGADGNPAMIGGMAIDVTDQKQAEEALRQRMDFDEAVMRNMGEGLYTVDARGLVTSMNPAAEKLFGWRFDELSGRKLHEATHYKHRDGTPFPADECAGLQVLRGGRLIIDHEDVFIRRDGTFFDVLFSSSPLRENDQIVGLVVVFTDITERKRGELNQQFLLGLGEKIRETSSVNALFASVCEMLGKHFTADRCFFNEIDLQNNKATVTDEYLFNSASPSFVGTIPVSAFSTEIPEIKNGKTVVVEDAKRDLRTARSYRLTYARDHVLSYIAVPLLRESVWRGTLWVSKESPHAWEEWEIGLVQTVAERTWLAAEKLRSEKSLRDSEARYRNLANAMPQLVWTTDSDGRVDYYNSLAQSRYNIRLVKKTGFWDWQSILHQDDLRTTESAWDSAQRSGYYEVEHRIKVADGSYRWHLSKASPVWDEAGEKIVKWFGTATDIHDYKTAQQALIRAERKAADEYQALLARIVPLAATLGRARDLTSIYRAVREFISASMTCSGFFVSFFEPENSMRLAAYVWGEGEEVDISELPPMPLVPVGGGANSRAVFEKRTIITNNYWDEMKNRPHVVLRPNGRDPLSSLIVPMMIKDTVLGTLEVQAHENEAYNQEHAVALEMAANLAAVAIENVRLIETEAAARESAESANRAKDEFLSVLSHELRTPLNAMLGWVRMLKAGVLDEENADRALEVIERNTRLQSSLIEDLLDVSRIISGKMRIETELVDLVSVVQTASETIEPLADAKNISYRFSHGDEAVFLTADSVRMQQVVSNLLQNAIKFTPSGGRIETSLERTGTDAILCVTDTGVGIETDLLPYIFDRFRQADASARRSFTGLGLGLTIVRNIVELHGGSVDVRSDGKDRGSTFTLKFPLAADFYNSMTLGSERVRPETPALAGKAILLVDDDAENLLPLKLFLENEKAEVTPAESAVEALKYLAERDFHLMIADIGMPDIDGYELVAKLRADTAGRNAGLNAIALTAYASVDDRERALESGFQAHVTKPVNFDELLETIERVSRNGENVVRE